ncbi:FAD1 flavin adenine dinucleotide synthetase [Phlyctochytrium planicorne]|nr:FAD1 flavin adenine dinucleotide synthetase [Phlyctochytrium planicorne]
MTDLLKPKRDAPVEKEAEAVEIIKQAIEKYGWEGTAISFNGGKDCTVLLHMLSQFKSQNGSNPLPLNMPALYVAAHDAFPDVEKFVSDQVECYGLRLMRVEKDMKQGLQDFLDEYPNVAAILIGTRRTDPYSQHLNPFSETDNGWPKVMRVHPILDWSYHDVWSYLLHTGHPYCCLYDQGYTSLGGTSNTLPNPELRNPNASCGYDAAYTLKDGSTERSGRIKSQKKT